MTTLLESLNDTMVEDPWVDIAFDTLKSIEINLIEGSVSNQYAINIIDELISSGCPTDIISDVLDEGKFMNIRRAMSIFGT